MPGQLPLNMTTSQGELPLHPSSPATLYLAFYPKLDLRPKCPGAVAQPMSGKSPAKCLPSHMPAILTLPRPWPIYSCCCYGCCIST